MNRIFVTQLLAKKRATLISESETENEDQVLHDIATSRKRARVIISDFKVESGLDTFDTSSDKEIFGRKSCCWDFIGNEGVEMQVDTIFKDVCGPTAYAKRHSMYRTRNS